MNGPIAQIVALACHANAVLQGRPVAAFFPANSTCQYCDFVRFVRPDGETPLAATPDAWFDFLKTSECRRILVRYGSQDARDRVTAGLIGGGGTWSLETQLANRSAFYQAAWQVWNQKAPQQRIWRVTYRLVAERDSSPAEDATDFAALEADFLAVLREIQVFARRQRLAEFADCFQRAMNCLEGKPCEPIYHKDLAPQGFLSPASARLLSAAQAAHVFGAMGSWNDVALANPGRQTYETLSVRLFDLLNRVICAATNSTARP